MTKKREHTRPSGSDPAPGAWGTAFGAVRRNPGITAAVGAIAALAGAAWFNGRRAEQAEVDNPPAGDFIEIDGVRLHYVVRGEGRPVVLLHGNGAMIQDWEASGVLDQAAARYRVIAFDRPGFGHSERPRTTVWTPAAQAALIHRALERLGVEQPVVVGHSWGTLVALAMALDFQQDIAALVLLSGYYFPTSRPDVIAFSGPAVPLLGDAMRATISPLVGRMASPLMAKTIFAPQPVPESFAGFPMEMALRPSQIRAVAADTAMMVPAAAQLSARYAELTLPVVIAAGEGDLIVFFDDHAQRLHDAVLGSELRKITGAGHMIHYADPAGVIAAINRAAERSAHAVVLSAIGKAVATGADFVPANAEATF